MITFPVKSGMSFTLNLLLGGKDCEITELMSPMVSFRERYLGRKAMFLINTEKRKPQLQHVSGKPRGY